MVAILILNWNGWEDTIACLKSIFSMSFDDYFVILGDNGSTDESKVKISDYCKEVGKNHEWISLNSKQIPSVTKTDILLYDLIANNGFAKGNNMMVKIAWQYSPNYYLLLNNDTEVEHDFLAKLISYQTNNPHIKVLSPLIYYYYEKNRVWNAGGKIFWGVRKYFYGDCVVEPDNIPEYLSCTFITGCALLCTPDILKDDRTLFTEAFFHGEEDFEFALRMKKERVEMGCYTQSIIYHKVGRSSGRGGHKIGLIYCHYLNRFINLRHNLNFLSFYAFIIVYSLYVMRLLHKCGLTYWNALKFYCDVIIESHKLETVSYHKFNECLSKSFI